MDYVNDYDYQEHVVQSRHVLSYLSREYMGGLLRQASGLIFSVAMETY